MGHLRLSPRPHPLLPEAETDFYAEYDRLVGDNASKVGLDLNSNLQSVEEHLMEVRVV